jgi:hypothetical protein
MPPAVSCAALITEVARLAYNKTSDRPWYIKRGWKF